jgi:hypothetical protein
MKLFRPSGDSGYDGVVAIGLGATPFDSWDLADCSIPKQSSKTATAVTILNRHITLHPSVWAKDGHSL